MGNLIVDFVSFPEITNLTVIGEDKIHSNDNYTLETWNLMDKVYNKTVIVNGRRLVISMNIENKHDFRSYTITLKNRFGSANISITFRSASKQSYFFLYL